MSNVTVVYAHIDSINEEPTWHPLPVDSIEAAERIVPTREGSSTLLGTSHPRRPVAVYRAAYWGCAWRPSGDWMFTLAKFFAAKLQQAPRNAFSLAPFFDQIDDASAKRAAQQAIARLCGINVPDVEFGEMHAAILEINANLEALGIPSGDWTFDPMRAAFREIRID